MTLGARTRPRRCACEDEDDGRPRPAEWAEPIAVAAFVLFCVRILSSWRTWRLVIDRSYMRRNSIKLFGKV